MSEQLILIGYSGHAYVAASAWLAAGGELGGYCDRAVNLNNPFGLPYLGREDDEVARDALRKYGYLIAIGDNQVRRKIADSLGDFRAITVVHPTAVTDALASVGAGTLVGAGATINVLARVGRHAIINTGATVEHDCEVGDYAHVAPGAVLLGNVKVGKGTLIGANAVVLPGLTIGADCTVGAGAVVLRDVPDGTTVVGNPARPVG